MYTIGWIAALDKELTAALAMLDERHRQPDDFEQNDKDSNNYSWGRVGDHNIVIASLGGGSYGLVSAATTATCMANSLPHLRFGLLVGIGAGVPDLEENDVRLGDVVVSLPKNGHPGVVQYDLGKLRENDQFQRVGALAPPPTVLLKAVDKLRAEQRLKGSKLPQILSQAVQNYPMLGNPKGRDPAFIYQGAKNDRLFEPTSVHVPGGISCQNLSGGMKRRRIGDTESCDGCDAEREIKREERSTSDPEIHYGTIASGNSVIKDGAFRGKVLKRLGTDVLCYEMEAAGLVSNFPCLVVRGICDYADSHKNDRWQNYAALVAAAYTKDLLCVVEARTIEKADRLEEIMTSVSRHTSQIISATTNTNQAVQGLTDSQQSQKLHRWLCAPDPSVNFNWAISQHLSGTGEWFLESEEYRRWKTSPGSSLWLYGIPGCGKTILSSAIIYNLKRVAADKHLLFFYFTFTATSKQSLDGAVRSLIGQLCSKSRLAEEYIASLIASEYNNGSEQPSTTSLCEAFERITQMCDEIYIVLDALDECNLGCNFKNEGCLQWLKSLLGSKYCNLHLLVTSRREHRIQIVFDEFISNQICLQTDTVDDDIRTFIDKAIRTWDGLKAWQGHDHVQKEIQDYLTENARGM
ncbi:Vegetative incompatibility protein HET-E-1 [Colletotrichum viniferum]|nr:Vegetative incompatibility protein HET-E-1 [Colletotrichum viniferum]